MIEGNCIKVIYGKSILIESQYALYFGHALTQQQLGQTCGYIFWKLSVQPFVNIIVKVSVFGVILARIQSKCGEMRIRITPNVDTFHAVCLS